MPSAHRVIPVFLPMLACPHRCVYCNQYVISGQQKLPSLEQVTALIDRNLQTIPHDCQKRVAFFGGSFTCLPEPVQNRYLDAVQPYLQEGRIEGIQLSTRPDYIDDHILQNLKSKGVTLIELGAQSLNDDILARCGRGHTVADVENASRLIRKHGIDLGLQMMIGLPGDTKAKALHTAEQIVAFGASCTRIYPTLVVDGTALADDYRNGRYVPLSLEDAVDWCKELYRYFQTAGVTVLRMGLHPTQDLREGDHLLAGPFHISFRELVHTALWHDRIADQIAREGREDVVVVVPPGEMNYAVGYGSANRKAFPKVRLKT
ncbi:MAG: radical SAM protein [Bacteroidales bacterium]|nr:radical SAM protein [Bacteroidales bacterium]